MTLYFHQTKLHIKVQTKKCNSCHARYFPFPLQVHSPPSPVCTEGCLHCGFTEGRRGVRQEQLFFSSLSPMVWGEMVRFLYQRPQPLADHQLLQPLPSGRVLRLCAVSHWLPLPCPRLCMSPFGYFLLPVTCLD